jgi:hypothetical protein
MRLLTDLFLRVRESELVLIGLIDAFEGLRGFGLPGRC